MPFRASRLLPLVPEFLAQHPRGDADIVPTDEVVDILEQRTDVAVRGAAGSRAWWRATGAAHADRRCAIHSARHGSAGHAQAPLGHNRLGANYVRARSGWPLRDAGEELVVPLSGNAQASDGEALCRLAVAGLAWPAGRVPGARGHSRRAPDSRARGIQPGRWKSTPSRRPGRLSAPLRVRAFLDFLAERVDMSQG
ncbi:LysR substrate-binding domain-containing protein [Pseudomonas aeruginosa]|nr:LysR substrate-binding domain-containing protein [Pseudomonas aeruginosa]